MKGFSRQSFLYFISFMLMASAFLPLVFANLPPIIRSHHIWTAAWFLSLIAFYPKVFRNRLFLFVLFYGAVMLLFLLNTLWANIGDWNRGQIIEEFYEIAVAVSVISYFRTAEDFYRLAKLVKWMLLFIFITAIMTIVTAYIEPTYVRSLTGLSAIVIQSEIDYVLGYKKYGGGSYGFVAALLCLFPMLFYYYKNNIKSIIKKKYLVVFIIVIFFALLKTQIFANILISVFIIILSLMGSKHTNRIIILSSLLIIIVLFIPIKSYSDLLISISLMFPSDSEIYYKLNDLAKLIIIGGYSESGIFMRAERYPMLIDSFYANPLLGHFLSGLTNDISEGGHLHWMYKLAVYGLLGSVPFFYIIYKFIKNSLSYFDKEFAFYFLISVFSIIILGLMKTLAGRETWYMFFIIAPGLYYLQLLKNNKKNNNSESNVDKDQISDGDV